MTPPYNADLVLLRDALEIIQWMSGSSDFSPEGCAYQGWVKSTPKIDEIRRRLKDAGYQ